MLGLNFLGRFSGLLKRVVIFSSREAFAGGNDSDFFRFRIVEASLGIM